VLDNAPIGTLSSANGLETSGIGGNEGKTRAATEAATKHDNKTIIRPWQTRRFKQVFFISKLIQLEAT
jgi:hypothetical protein